MQRIVPVAEWTYTLMQRRAGLVVTTTESWARVLRRRRMRRVAVVRNTAMAISEPLPVPPNRPGGALHVLYVGNFGRAQHLATAIRAASLCHQEGVPVRLRLVGVGAEADAMRLFNSRLGNRPRSSSGSGWRRSRHSTTGPIRCWSHSGRGSRWSGRCRRNSTKR